MKMMDLITELIFCIFIWFYLQTLVDCRTWDTSRACRRNRSAPWKSTAGRSTPTNRSVLANCSWGCLLYVPSRRKSSSNSSSSGWSAKRPSRHSSATCSYPVPVSIGPTCRRCEYFKKVKIFNFSSSLCVWSVWGSWELRKCFCCCLLPPPPRKTLSPLIIIIIIISTTFDI